MVRALIALAGDEQFFEQLLAGPDAAGDDLDILADLEPRELDQVDVPERMLHMNANASR